MFTAEGRGRVRSEILEYAAADGRISGAAITGSGAVGEEDRWSDIDLAFGVVDEAAVAQVLADWTAYMYERHSAVHHVDVRAGAWVYRVFLLSSTLQVDLAFVAAGEFRALAPTFRVIFGNSGEPMEFPKPAASELIGMGWLYALHARSAIRRGKLWQAEYMISGVRNQVFALACLRHGLPAVHARGVDALPAAVTGALKGSLPGRLEGAEMARAFGVAVAGLMGEIRAVDDELAVRVEEAVMGLAIS